ncbi:macro domain-containing protein [Nocardioides caricicola]|uniref:Macro domain-containing protein n=1 Tax=Nocardioides caricicola TaxID=634770 RepID=A0ABW0N775_9ACTN
MALEKTSGDLLAAEVDALVNTVNCVGVMGKGIALQFKRRFPAVFKEYAAACRDGRVEVGHMHVVPTGLLDGPQWVINFPTKKHWRSPSRLEYIRTGLDDLKRTLKEYGIESVAIPPLGAGNGGLDWADVEPLIVQSLGDLTDVRVVLYEPSAGRRNVEAPEQIKMTWGRALLIALLDRYVAQRELAEPWEDQRGASHLEIQKLMYFADLLEPKLDLRFQPGRYGPYSERVRHLLQGMEGAYTVGLGDGADRVLDLNPIAPTERGLAEASKFLDDEKYVHVPVLVDRVMEVVKGFEGPYGVELLASADWVCRRQAAEGVVQATKLVHEWTHRKGRLFTEHHVGRALDQLHTSGALI